MGTNQPLPVVTVTERTIRETSYDYTVARVENLFPDSPTDLRRAFNQANGGSVFVTVGVKDPVTTQFVNVSFRMESCSVKEQAGHLVEVIAGPTCGSLVNRTELLFVDGKIQVVTLVNTEVEQYAFSERS